MRAVPLLLLVLALVVPWMDAISDVGSELCDIEMNQQTGDCRYTDTRFLHVAGVSFATLLAVWLAVSVLLVRAGKQPLRPMINSTLAALLTAGLVGGGVMVWVSLSSDLPAQAVLGAVTAAILPVYLLALRCFGPAS